PCQLSRRAAYSRTAVSPRASMSASIAPATSRACADSVSGVFRSRFAYSMAIVAAPTVEGANESTIINAFHCVAVALATMMAARLEAAATTTIGGEMRRLISALRGKLVPFVLLAVSLPVLAQGTAQRGGT